MYLLHVADNQAHNIGEFQHTVFNIFIQQESTGDRRSKCNTQNRCGELINNLQIRIRAKQEQGKPKDEETKQE